MTKATLANGSLIDIENCYIRIPDLNDFTIPMNILPDISDSKSASYPDVKGMGRSMPFKTYENSENRAISWTAHFFACSLNDFPLIIEYMRALEACLYPMEGTGGVPYSPPPICLLRCGRILGEDEICAVLKNYSIKFDTTVPWEETSLMPYKLDIDLQFDVVYNQADLPGADRIFNFGV